MMTVENPPQHEPDLSVHVEYGLARGGLNVWIITPPRKPGGLGRGVVRVADDGSLTVEEYDGDEATEGKPAPTIRFTHRIADKLVDALQGQGVQGVPKTRSETEIERLEEHRDELSGLTDRLLSIVERDP